METSTPPPSYYYLEPSTNVDGEAEEDLFDSNGTHITSEYLNDMVAKSMSDRYTVEDDPSGGGSAYKCNECDQALRNTGHLVGHIVTHTGETPYVCSLCQRSFTNSTRLKLHLRVHCIQKPQPGLTVTRITKSPQASTAPTVSGASVEPAMTPASETDRTFRCIECEKVFPKDELYRHMKQHLLEKNIFAQKTYKCDRCNEGFDKGVSLDRHQEECLGFIQVSSEVELVPIRKPDATVAKKKIEENPILSGLLMRESNEPPVPHVPTVVELDSPFEDEGEEEMHKSPANGDDLEQLPEVVPSSPGETSIGSVVGGTGGGFIISSVATVDQQFLESLAQMELQAQTPELEELPLEDTLQEIASMSEPAAHKLSTGSATVCGLCGKSFNEPFGLRQHMRIMHAETKPFKCPECKKTFAQERSMYIHLRVHVSQRPFICIACYKTFTRSTALNGHMSCHAHDTIKCLDCGTMVTNIANYAKHVETKHPNFPELLDQIRNDRPEHERCRILRRILMENMASHPANGDQPVETHPKLEPTFVD